MILAHSLLDDSVHGIEDVRVLVQSLLCSVSPAFRSVVLVYPLGRSGRCWQGGGGDCDRDEGERSARAVETYVRQVASGWSDYLAEGESVPLFWAGQGTGAVWARQDGGWVHTEGMLAARASGTTNRNGDPQLHHHVVIANLARRATDGQWRALDGQLLWPARSWATQVWGRTFRRELSRRTGLEWGPENSRGDRELVGVPAGLVELWSSRDREIDVEQARLEDELGKPVGKAARLIISARTRQHKDLAERMGQRRERWRREAEACAAGVVARLQRLGTGPVSLPATRWTAPSLAAAVAAELTGRRAVWDADEWLRTTARVAGDGVGTEVLEQWSAEALRDAGGKTSPVLALAPVRQGRHVPEAGVCFRLGGERWTTVENRRAGGTGVGMVPQS